MIYPQIQRQRSKVEKHINRAMRLAEAGRLGTASTECGMAVAALDALMALVGAHRDGEVHHDA